jgi:hypothetical protein
MCFNSLEGKGESLAAFNTGPLQAYDQRDPVAVEQNYDSPV